MSNDPKEVLADCRSRIDKIDGALLALLRERLVVAQQASTAKQQLGESIYSPAREREVIDRVHALATGPLAPMAAVRIFEAIIEETRASQWPLVSGQWSVVSGQ